MSSLSWPAVVGTYINTSIGTLANVGNGDFTIIALTKPASTGGHAVIGMQVASSYDIQIIVDTGVWFGGGDFSGFGTATTDWQIIGQSKASGTNVLRWHYWNYTLGGAKTHTNGTGTHANPGSIANVHIGDGDNRGNGLNAAIAVWKRVLADAEFDSLCTTNLSDWMNVSGGAPDAIWALNVAAASVVDGTGHGANASSVAGTISLTGADPPSFNYALTASTPSTGGIGFSLPPTLVQQLAAARAAQFAPDRGPVTVSGTANATLGGLAGAATGTPTVGGTAAAPLGALAAAATGTGTTPPPPGGAGAAAIPPVLLQQLAAARAAQFAPDRGPITVSGTASAALGGLTAAAAGTPTIGGTASAPLGGLAAAAVGTPTVSGTTNAALGALTAAATGTGTTPPPAGGGAPSIPPALLQQLAVARAAQFAPSSTANVVTGTASATLGGLTAASAGVRTVLGTAAAGLGRVAAGATGARSTSGSASAALGGLAAAAVQRTGTHMSGEAHGPLPVATGSVIVHTGTIAGAIT